MSTLHLPLKKKWFDMTKSGIKTEDYRELNLYWTTRLCFKYENKDGLIVFTPKEFTCNIMTLGYPKGEDQSRVIKLEHKGIEIRTGNPEWGAEEGKLYFVIKHGS